MPTVDHDLDTIRARAAEVAERLLGQPTWRSRHEWRWGRRGSLALRVAGPKAGLWYHHEAGEGGEAQCVPERAESRAAEAPYDDIDPAAVQPDRRDAQRRGDISLGDLESPAG